MLSDEQLQRIHQLVAKYEVLSPAQRRRYNEANTRKDFIEPLFEALGWDVRDKEEVDAEKAVKPGFADYAFLLNGLVQFYVEAKPLEDDIYNEAYGRQVITYAYSKGDTWAILCNFKGLQVFNAQWDTPNPDRARVLNLTWDQYSDAGSPIFLLSRRAFEEGSLEKHAQTFGAMRPRIPVEKGLYRHMHRWRERLVRHFSTMGKGVTLGQADEAAERLISRLIFVRSSEDRHIEAHRLRAALHHWRQSGAGMGLTEELGNVFTDYNHTFDSDLFAPHLLDDLLSQFAADTQVQSILGDMLAELHTPPRSSADYDFSVIDADVLGRVYEQYLGYVAQVTKERADQAQRQLSLGLRVETIGLESKRRKERGIYYTPKWVVDYIVTNTVGRFLAEHSHDDVLNMKVLDPACGSGSFLIRAFDTLLEHHADIKRKTVAELAQYDRLPVLTGNIYGVDLDRQAVDIARLNLLLRAVARRELLPSLEHNIQHGNSLIDGDEASLKPFFGDGWEEKHPFNWAQGFPQVIERGGFDIIIGNPPYVRIQTLPRDEVGYYNETYGAATGSYDIYALFVERGLHLLRPGGLLGFIIPNKFMQAAYGKGLRSLLADAKAVWKIVDFGDAQVFESGTNYTCLLLLQKQATSAVTYVPAGPAAKADPARPNLAQAEEAAFPAVIAASQATWVFVPAREEALMGKLRQHSVPLGDVCEKVFVGLQTSADDVYIMELLGERDDKLLVRSRRNGRQYALEKAVLKPLLSGHDVKRYYPPHARFALLFPYHVTNRKASLITTGDFSSSFPGAWEYLLENKDRLEGREGGKMRHERWYDFVYRKNLGLHEEPKICVPRLVTRLVATYEADGSFYLDNVDVNGVLGLADPYYVLAALNSQLINFYFQRISVPFHSGFRSANRQFIEPLPIRKLDGFTGAEAQTHGQIASLARRMLDLHQRLAAKGEVQDNEREEIEREVAITDRQIDDLVYDLYGLTVKERALVESEVRR